MKFVLTALALLGLCQLAPAAAAESYPARPIRIIVPFAPGGPIDALARIYGNKLQEKWGQSVIVESKPGAAGIIGMRYVAAAPPDGYTLVINYLGNAIREGIPPAPPFKLDKDFTNVAGLATTPFMLMVNADVPVKSVAELIELARKQPDGLNYGSSGLGSPSHLAGEMLKRSTNTNLIHVPYKGQGPATIALVAGDVQFSFASPATGLAQMRSGKLRALAVRGPKRASFAPDLPTVAQAGIAGFAIETWDGLAAPAGTPPEIVKKLSDAVLEIQAMPDVKQQLATIGLEPLAEDTRVFSARVDAEIEKWTDIAKAANVTIQ